MPSVPVRCEALEGLWPGTLPEPQRSRFESTWGSTLDVLDREAFHLGATEVVLVGGWLPSMIRRDGWPKAGARLEHDRIIVRLAGTKHGDLSYPCATFDRWQDNVRAVALALEALRKVDRYGVTRRGEQYRGFAQLVAGRGNPDPARGRRLIAEHGGIAAALKATHPDTGGDADAFADVQAARADGAS